MLRVETSAARKQARAAAAAGGHDADPDADDDNTPLALLAPTRPKPLLTFSPFELMGQQLPRTPEVRDFYGRRDLNMARSRSSLSSVSSAEGTDSGSDGARAPAAPVRDFVVINIDS